MANPTGSGPPRVRTAGPPNSGRGHHILVAAALPSDSVAKSGARVSLCLPLDLIAHRRRSLPMAQAEEKPRPRLPTVVFSRAAPAAAAPPPVAVALRDLGRWLLWAMSGGSAPRASPPHPEPPRESCAVAATHGAVGAAMPGVAGLGAAQRARCAARPCGTAQPCRTAGFRNGSAEELPRNHGPLVPRVTLVRTLAPGLSGPPWMAASGDHPPGPTSAAESPRSLTSGAEQGEPWAMRPGLANFGAACVLFVRNVIARGRQAQPAQRAGSVCRFLWLSLPPHLRPLLAPAAPALLRWRARSRAVLVHMLPAPLFRQHTPNRQASSPERTSPRRTHGASLARALCAGRRAAVAARCRAPGVAAAQA